MRPGARHAGFPAQYARTRRFSLGRARSFTAAPDGSRIAFLRSPAGDDPVHALWVVDLPDGAERCVADPAELADGDDRQLPPEERARRERVRESGAGIVAYATDRDLRTAVFTLGGLPYAADLDAGTLRRLPGDGPVLDPRPDPAGELVACVRDGGLHLLDLRAADAGLRPLVGEDDPDVSWGLAEFVAAEEMGRTRGYWWSPDSRRLAVARVDTGPVPRWYLADPAEPSRPPTVLSYPAAGAANALVTLELVGLSGARTPVRWDHDAMPYLAAVSWEAHAPLTLLVQARDQRHCQTLTVAEDGATEVVGEQRDAHWVELVAGVPAWLPGGRLLHTVDDPDGGSGAGARRLAVDGVALSPPWMQVRRVVHAGGDGVVVVASGEDPTAQSVWRVPTDGGPAEPLTARDGLHDAAGNQAALVLQSRGLSEPGARVTVHGRGRRALTARAEAPMVEPRPRLLRLGPRRLCAALLLPRDHEPGGARLPVLLDPYGGPHAQRVTQHREAYCVPQWFADAGFAVLVIDGRGSPGRGPAWERMLAGDLAGPVLEDQVDGLRAAAERFPALDLGRVAVRGWSFGGYLAAMAVLRRPDVFHSAVAGAPVTDWRLYDTHYTERYLGLPGAGGPEAAGAEVAPAYRRSSLLDDVARATADRPARPVLLIHGLADDNVVAAHTLRLARRLLEAGHPHRVLPLPGVTHMTPQVEERLLHVQLSFLRETLGLTGG